MLAPWPAPPRAASRRLRPRACAAASQECEHRWRVACRSRSRRPLVRSVRSSGWRADSLVASPCNSLKSDLSAWRKLWKLPPGLLGWRCQASPATTSRSLGGRCAAIVQARLSSRARSSRCGTFQWSRWPKHFLRACRTKCATPVCKSGPTAILLQVELATDADIRSPRAWKEALESRERHPGRVSGVVTD